MPIWVSEDKKEIKCIGSVGDLKNEIQKAVEAGFMKENPFAGFKEGEDQIVQGMVDLGKYTAVMYGKVPIANGWKAKVVLTGERKYDFITGTGRKELPLMNQRSLVNQFPISSIEREKNSILNAK